MSTAVVTRVADLLERETGERPPAEDLSALLEYCVDGYRRARETSRDGLPTTAQMAARTAAIADHLHAAVQLLLERPASLHLNVWLDTFMAERGHTESGAFLNLGEYYIVATKAADYFEELAARGETPIVDRADGTTEVHARQTRTSARDEALIPMLLALLRQYGLRLRTIDGRLNLEAIDAACDAIAAVLSDQGIKAPDAGATGHGETHQGRLRRIVKSAWDALPVCVDK